ncbi:MAG: SDR family NAD(P)-dependent oxidoreductase [Pirellulales bacterium]
MSERHPQPVALVTGAGRRVGYAVAGYLAKYGYRLAVHAHRSLDRASDLARRISDGGTEAVAVSADVSDQQQVESMVAEVHERFGRIDALVNSAAVWSSGKLEDVKAEDVRKHFEINALGTFLCCQQVGLLMVGQSRGGAIVNIGDWAVVRPYTDYAAYFPSKGAIATMTRMFAVELASRNPDVRVNAIAPGPVLLPEGLSPAERDAIVASTLVRRAGSPEHVAHAVRFLIENDFVTGVTLPVDGGRTVYAPGEARD